MAAKRKKIAVIGGGMSALTSVYEIIKTPDWRQKYDITIYQQGWRIGGKGASGRNMSEGARIEEHGLHIWFGFYTNAFNLIKDCYGQLEPNPSAFKTWKDAFKPQSYIPLQEYIDGEWETWGLNFPTNSLEPGGKTEFLPLWAYIQMTLRALFGHLREVSQTPEESEGIIDQIKDKAIRLLIGQVANYVEKALELALKAGKNLEDAEHEDSKMFHSHFHEFWDFLKNKLADLLSHNRTTRHVFIILDLCITSIKGVLKDQLLTKGLNSVNNEEYRAWLDRHGAADLTINSTLVQALYDVGFAYEEGDIAQPSYEAGSAIRIIIELGLAYKGAFMWKMQAGMGDTIFTPIYEIFNRYKPSENEGGITFAFFHKTMNLGLSPDKKSIQNIDIQIQATVKGNAPYQPFVSVKDLACWPSKPNYDQLVEGEVLQKENVNLESFWTPWKGVQNISLQKGKDFDLVILGTPIATLPHLCPELIDANQKWQTMIQAVKTTQTQAYQIWLNKDLQGLGWDKPSPIMTSFVEPVDTWADMSQLIVREEYPEGQVPKNISYFCGVFKDASIIPPPNVHSFPAEESNRVKDGFVDYINDSLGWIFPAATTEEHPRGLDYNVLIDLKNRQGVDRVDGQFWRANIDPSERYTLTNVNSSVYRLKTDESGFENLYITGDWIQNTFNYGCIEACVMSGMMTARAVTGVDIKIVGENAW